MKPTPGKMLRFFYLFDVILFHVILFDTWFLRKCRVMYENKIWILPDNSTSILTKDFS